MIDVAARFLFNNRIKYNRETLFEAMPFFYCTFTSNQEKHRKIWSSIFRSSKGASAVTSKGFNPVFLGYDLWGRYNNTGKPAYIVLTTGDNKGGTYKETC